MTHPGLSDEEAARRLDEVGPNELEHAPPPSPWALLGQQFANPMVALLLGAALLAGVLGEWIDAVAIGAIVVLNAVVGFVQEFRAERALQALQDMTAPRATVRREGRARQIPAAEVVPGDVLLLEAGDLVAADARLVSAHALQAVEAALTGESVPSTKSPEPVPEDTALADRTDHVFAGTAIANGTGVAEVEATGMSTEVGRIAELLSGADRGSTPLQERLEEVTRKLLVLCLGVVAVVALLGLLHGTDWLEVLLGSVSLAVAAVPEGLPAVVTIALALGVQRMAGRHVLVRRLPAVETLGAATVICTDKTGTLTTGRMAVRDVWGTDRRALLYAAAACNDAELTGEGGVGDTTEVALLLAARERGIERADIEADNPRVDARPFDSDRKRMSVLRDDGIWYVKGATEAVLPLCDGMDDDRVSEEVRDMAASGLRVLALARGEGGEEEGGLEFLGLLGLADPPRPEAIAAVQAARGAGIRTVMITGDHPVTARAIASELGILGPSDEPDEVVHARVTPEDKLTIVRQWKERGAVVAMTGDGVNDAPAIREAHIGIAMGITGTEVTREASSVVLTDDNFASIVEGVREGRTIHDNIRKTLVYLLSGNSAELFLMLGASIVGLPMPLIPLHLLWINLVTDGLPALALVTDPPDADTMRRPPRDPEEPMLARPQWSRIALTGLVEGVMVLGVFAWTYEAYSLDFARDMAFTTLVFSELLRAFAARSTTRVIWEVGPFSNLWLLGVVLVSGAVQIGLHHVTGTAALFHLADIGWGELGIALVLGFVPVSVLEIAKLVRRAA